MRNVDMKESIYAALCGSLGRRRLPKVGTTVDGIYTVILCPVCGHKTLDLFDICRHCGWEYDGVSGEHRSSANGASLLGYREEYKKARKDLKKKDASIL